MHVEKNSTIKTTHKFEKDLSFGQKISYIMETLLKDKLNVIDKGEPLSVSDHQPSTKKNEKPVNAKWTQKPISKEMLIRMT